MALVERKIRVAHIFLTLNIGGMEKVGVDLINNIDTERFENYVLCLKEIGPLGERLESSVQDLSCLNAENGVGLRGLLAVMRYLRRNKIDVVHTNNPSPHFWGSLAARLCGIRAVVHTVHGRGFIRHRKGALIEKVATLMSSVIVCVSADAAEQRKQIGIAADKLRVISNGVDTGVFCQDVPNAELVAALNQEGALVIGSVARFSVDKDQKSLIEAFARLRDQVNGVKLLLVGDGETKPDMESLARQLSLGDSVIFTGARSDVLDLLRLMDVYVLATHTEGLSISLLEAMSTERAVVATAVGGNVEVIEHDVNGLLVPESDVDKLAQALSECIASPDKRQEMASSARETVLSRYSMKSMVDQYQSLYVKYC